MIVYGCLIENYNRILEIDSKSNKEQLFVQEIWLQERQSKANIYNRGNWDLRRQNF